MLIEYIAHDNSRQQNLRESLSNIDHGSLLFKWKYHLVAASWGKDEPAEVADLEEVRKLHDLGTLQALSLNGNPIEEVKR